MDTSGDLALGIISRMPIGVVVLDTSAVVVGWNDWMCAHAGIGRERALGTALEDLFEGFAGSPLAVATKQVLATGQPVVFSQALHKHALPLFNPRDPADAFGARTVEQAIKLYAVNDSEGERHCVLQIEDVTASVHREQRLRAKSIEAENARNAERAFLTNMSHEIRTPMNGVLGVAELLTHTGLSTEQAEYVRTIRESGEALLAVINDVLDFSKIEAGKLAIEPLVTDLHRLLLQVTELLRPRVNSARVSFELCIEPSVPQFVKLDSTRVRQVLTNLIGNAIKFTCDGAVRVRVSYDGASERLTAAVRDTGIGIADPSRLFQQFVQEDASTARRFGGTGLGLSISRSLAELMGGTVSVASESGVGSVFTFDWHAPTAIGPHDEESELEDCQVLSTTRPVSAGVALLVEDNATNQLVATRFLRKLDWQVDVAGNGFEALERVRTRSYDVVFMDCQMPEMDGYEATRRIRQLSPPACDLHIIAMTAHVLQGERERCLAAGMNDYLTKPINLKRLRDALTRERPELERKRA